MRAWNTHKTRKLNKHNKENLNRTNAQNKELLPFRVRFIVNNVSYAAQNRALLIIFPLSYLYYRS